MRVQQRHCLTLHVGTHQGTGGIVICPIETPEGPNIGLISNLTSYGKINEYGFIQTPYRLVNADCTVQEEAIYLSADEEADYVIAQANEVVEGRLVNEQVVARKGGDTIIAKREEVELADVSPKQIVSVATASRPDLMPKYGAYLLIPPADSVDP